MAFNFNNSEIKRTTVNGVDVEKINFNGVDSHYFIDTTIKENEENRINKEISDYNQRLTDLNITKSGYMDLTEYENRRYLLDDGSIYDTQILEQRESFIFGVGDLLVSTTGSNTTGDGSELNPYASWEHAILQIPLSGGVNIWIESGTYSMNSGSGYAQIARDFALEVVIKSKPNELVTLTSTLNVQCIRFIGTNSFLTFQHLDFLPINGVSSIFYSTTTAILNNISILDCNIRSATDLTFFCRFQGAGSFAIKNLKVNRNIIDAALNQSKIYVYNVYNIDVVGNTYTSGTTNSTILEDVGNSKGAWNISNNIITANSMVNLNSIFMVDTLTGWIDTSTLNIKRNIVNQSGRFCKVQNSKGLPFDVALNVLGNTFNTTSDYFLYCTADINSGEVKYNNITGKNVALGLPEELSNVANRQTSNLDIQYNNIVGTDHVLLIGENSLNQTVNNNILNAENGLFAFVCKGDGHQINNNLMLGGTRTGLYYKNCKNCVAKNNTMIQTVSGGSVIEYAEGNAFLSFDNDFSDNLAYISNGGNYIKTGGIGEGNTNNSNVYDVSNGGNYGVMFGSNVITLSEVVSSWATNYPSNPTNDNLSIEN